MKKTIKVAAATLTLAAGLAATSASAVEITWGDITGFTDGDTNVTFDFSSIGLGTVGVTIDAANPAATSQTLTTDGPGVDAENHPGFTSVSGDVIFMAGVTARNQVDFTFDFSGYTGLPGSLVWDFGALAGNDVSGGSDLVFLTSPVNVLDDLNGNGFVGAQNPGDDVTIDVTGAGQNDGDFLLGGFEFSSPITVQVNAAFNDGYTIGLGVIPVPAPASALLLLAGLALGRRKLMKQA